MAQPYGYRYGDRILTVVPLDSTTADITADATAITETNATSGFFKEVDAAAEAVAGFSVSKVDSPSADGGASVTIDTSRTAVYEFPPDAGTVTEDLLGNLVDIGSDGQSIDIDGTTTQDLRIVKVDTTANTVYVTKE